MRYQWSRRRKGFGRHSPWNRFQSHVASSTFLKQDFSFQSCLLCQMISSNWEASVADFERSFLYLQMVIVISMFYALFPLQVVEPFSKCPPSKARSQAIVLVLAKANFQVLLSAPFPVVGFTKIHRNSNHHDYIYHPKVNALC